MNIEARDLARKLLARSTVPDKSVPTSLPQGVSRTDSHVPDAAQSWRLQKHADIAATAERFDGIDQLFTALDVPNPLFLPHEGMSGTTIRQLGVTMSNFGCFNYVGLSSDSRVGAAAKSAIDTYGTSVSASRIVSGEIPLYGALESQIADIYGVDDAVVTASGYLTNAAAIGYLLGPGDVAVCDALVHSSIVSGTEWAGCRRVTFRHNDPDALEAVLRMSRRSFKRSMVVLESHYSMDGDVALLPEMIEVARRYECSVMIDEAHSLGVLGDRGLGLRELYDLPGDAVDLWMGTLSKSLGSVGGFLAGPREVIRGFKYSAPGLSMFATAPAPASIAAASTALEILRLEPDRVTRLRRNSSHAFELARSLGFDTGIAQGTAILPIIIGDTQKAVSAQVALMRAGVSANAITYPSVPVGSERLRFFLSSEHSIEQIEEGLETLSTILDVA